MYSFEGLSGVPPVQIEAARPAYPASGLYLVVETLLKVRSGQLLFELFEQTGTTQIYSELRDINYDFRRSSDR